MSNEAKRQYVNAVRDRYKKSRRKQKTAILAELCAICGFSRKYAIRLLSGPPTLRTRKSGPKPKYRPELIGHLKHLWLSMGQICSKRMVAAIPVWLPFYEDVSAEIRTLLLRISASSIDRLLSPVKTKRGLSATNPARFFRSMIPIQPKDWDVQAPGCVQADTVAHCGDSLSGAFAWSLTVTDIHSCWTENRALWTKASSAVIAAMDDIEHALPFTLKRFKSDSGSEFLNYSLLAYFRERRARAVEYVRSRPYKKDDNCYVEQKNFTHVRELFGYERFDVAHLVPLMNKIYKELWNPLQNFFFPAMKILRKTRIGARIKKDYDLPKTPYQRLIESADTSLETRAALEARCKTLNPFLLQDSLEKRKSSTIPVSGGVRRTLWG